MKPYYEKDGICIYLGDSRDVLMSAAFHANLLLTDPPYGVQYETSWRSRQDVLRVPIAGDGGDLSWLWPVFRQLDFALEANSHVYLFSAPHRAGDFIKNLPSYWRFKNLLVWDKGEAGTVGDLECGYGMNHEAVVYAMKGRRPLNGPRPRAILRFPWTGTMDPVHPAVKPVSLLQTIIERSSDLGETVLDPFMGSGTTLIAAKQLGRKAIGIEIEERYCEISVKRLAQQVMDFSEPVPQEVQMEFSS